MKDSILNFVKVYNVMAREILDSRGDPTVEVDVYCSNGYVGTASVPSGASTGEKEAVEIRDNEKRFLGKGALTAVYNVNSILGPKINGMDIFKQIEIDRALVTLDGTPNKSRYGANAILGISLAVLKAAAMSNNKELYEQVGNGRELPKIFVNIINGGKHSSNNLEFQEFMIVPEAMSVRDRIRIASEVFHTLKGLLKEKGYSTNVGDEGAGTNTLVNLIDETLLNAIYPDSDEITSNVESYYAYFEAQYGEDLETTLSEQGYASIEDFKIDLKLDIKRQMAILDYVESKITDKEINAYYKNETKGDIRASHILITPDVTDDMTTEEETAAKTEALALAKSIITKLNNGEDFATLAKEYSDDSGSASSGGDLGYFNTGDMVESFETAAYKLEVGKYTTTPVESDYGYHIILLTDKEEKPELELIRDSIIEEIANNKLEEDTTLQYEAIIKFREEYGFKIYDSELEKDYNNGNKDLLSN